MKKLTVSVFGYGRFGKLWCTILSNDFHVKVYSRRGLKQEEVEGNIEIVDLESLYECDALFYCVAISAFEQVLKENSKLHREGCVYFDTCSVKMEPVKWMKKYIPKNCQIIATHPMFGPDSYFNSSEPLPIVMHNVNAHAENFEFWKNYFLQKNMRVEIMTPEEHDKTVAYSQGITHYIGRVLADLHLKPTKIDTLGYKKLLEIINQTCNDSWELFCDLQHFNPYTKEMREDLFKSIKKIYKVLENHNKNRNKKTGLSK